MGGLFATFNPQTVVIFEFAGNWVAALAALIILPQGYWLASGQYQKGLESSIGQTIVELRATLGQLITPGSFLIFVSLIVFIGFVNFLGLAPYVFTPSSHLSFTLSLALPMWLGAMVLSLIKQLDHNMAHLVPVGTPAGLMPMMVLIETVSSIIRPGALAVRLAANMVAGHLLLVLLGGNASSVGGLALMILILSLVALMALECAVACIQAYVFTILSALYMGEHVSLGFANLFK